MDPSQERRRLRHFGNIERFAAAAGDGFTPARPLRAPLDASGGKPPAEHESGSGGGDEATHTQLARRLKRRNQAAAQPAEANPAPRRRPN